MGESRNDRGGTGEETRRFPLYEWLVVLAVVGFLLSLAIPAIDVAREEARQIHCTNNLLQIGMGLANYQDAWKRFPPAYCADANGQPWSSWRVAIMPFFTCSTFYDQYTFSGEPWNSPGNLNLAEREGYAFRCPSQPSERVTASYLAVTGATTAWPGPTSLASQDYGKPASGVIHLVENRDSGIYWTEPRDVEFDRVDFIVDSPPQIRLASRRPGSIPALSSDHRGGANVLFADASVEFLPTATDPEVLKDMLRIASDATKVPTGPRKRVRWVPDLDAPQDVKGGAFKLESYWLDEVTSSVQER